MRSARRIQVATARFDKGVVQRERESKAMPPSRHLASRCTRLCLLAALALVPTSVGAAAQVIDAVAPVEGTVGTVVTISGSGLAAGRPRVFLAFDAGRFGVRKYRLDLLSVADGELRVAIDKAALGPCSLHVQLPAGGDASADFEVMPPQAGAVVPSLAVPGDTVVIQGAFLGAQPPRVLFLGRRATVLACQDDAVTVLVPAWLPDGQWTACVSNALASDWADVALTVTGSRAPLPAVSVAARVGSTRFLAPAAGVSAAILGAQVAVDAVPPGVTGQKLSLMLPFNMSTTPVPAIFGAVPVASQPIVYTLTSPANGAISLYVAMPGLLPWSIAVTGRSGGLLAGVFDGVLMRLAGAGPDTLPVSHGAFVITPQF